MTMPASGLRARLSQHAGQDTAFPHLSLTRQTEVERVLAQALADRGVRIERGTELAGVRRTSCVTARRSKSDSR
jgi:hypothetical protein